MFKKIFMLKKLLRDLNILISKSELYVISSKLDSPTLEYPFIFDEAQISSGKRQALIKQLDANGIPLNAPYIDVQDSSYHYYPISIGQLGIAVYHSYLKSQSEIDKGRFNKFAEWFIENAISENDTVYWVTNVEKPEYRMPKGWKSAFAQSRAISVLLRYALLNKDTANYKLIENALRLFFIPIEKKGISVKTQQGLFFEEYAGSEATQVLDGHLFSLFCFIDILKVKHSLPNEIVKLAEQLMSLGLNAIKDCFPAFDMGFWLKFNLCQMSHYPKIDPCTVSYMKLIRLQLLVLHRYTHDDYYQTLAIKISDYLTLKNVIHSYRIKSKALKQLNRL